MKSLFKFEAKSGVRIEETCPDRLKISGTLLVAGVSKNQRLYEIDELENIARNMVGKPVYLGTKHVLSPDGKTVRTLHDDAPENEIGHVTKTFLNRKKGLVRFVAEIFKTYKYQNLLNDVKAGWGVSIGGFVHKANFVKHLGKTVMKIKDMIVQHLALIKPSVSRGFDSAMVENVHEVSMTFTNSKGKMLSPHKLNLIIFALMQKGVI